MNAIECLGPETFRVRSCRGCQRCAHVGAKESPCAAGNLIRMDDGNHGNNHAGGDDREIKRIRTGPYLLDPFLGMSIHFTNSFGTYLDMPASR